MSDFEQFSAWVKENMRANTVIRNPEWWAKKLWNIAIASMQGEANPVAEIKNREVGYHYIHWYTLLQQLPVGTQLFTYPPSASAEITRLQKELEEARKVPDGYALVPFEPTGEIIKAMAESKAIDDEGQFPALCELIDFSGENKTRTVLKAAYAAMLSAAYSTTLEKGIV